jgi:hypothetical protein
MSAAARARRPSSPPFIDPPGYGRHRPESTLLSINEALQLGLAVLQGRDREKECRKSVFVLQGGRPLYLRSLPG